MPFVTGVDEAGLGAIAGPMTIGAVTLEAPSTRLDKLREWWPIKEVRDSKQMAEHERARALKLLLQYVSDFGGHIALGDADVELFNKYGHVNSLTFALNEVSDNICLGERPSLVLLDGMNVLPTSSWQRHRSSRRPRATGTCRNSGASTLSTCLRSTRATALRSTSNAYGNTA